MIRFNKHHVTDGTIKARVHYSLDSRTDGRKAVTLYAKDYSDNLGRVISDAYENNTETMTGYFERGTVRLFENHPLYAVARQRAESLRS